MATRTTKTTTVYSLAPLGRTQRWLPLYLLNQEPALAQSSMKLRDFDWSRVNDTVMGGRSSSSLDWQRDDTLLWRGNLSLRTTAALSRSAVTPAGLTGRATMVSRSSWKRRGVKSKSPCSAATFGSARGGYYAAVPTNAQGETRVFIPFEAFQLRSFGSAGTWPHPQGGLRERRRYGHDDR